MASRRPAFIALHLQEVGGKTYEKSMEYVQEFIKNLCESAELADYNRIRVYLDEDYNSAEHFTVSWGCGSSYHMATVCDGFLICEPVVFNLLRCHPMTLLISSIYKLNLLGSISIANHFCLYDKVLQDESH